MARTKEEQAAYMKEWYAKNQERQKAKCRAYYEANKEQAKERMTVYRAEHAVDLKEKKRVYHLAHKDAAQKRARRWYSENLDKAHATQKAYRKANPDKCSACQKACRAARLLADSEKERNANIVRTRRYQESHREELQEKRAAQARDLDAGYVTRLLNVRVKEVTPELLELKRLQLTIARELRAQRKAK